MFRILGFLLTIVLLLALSFGWHPMTTVKNVTGYHSSSSSEADALGRELELERKAMK